jgi:hypothetical protein
MRVGMGLIKNEHGVWHVRRKVPKALEAATARIMDVSKDRVSWLKETLRTKNEKQAKVLAIPVIMKFDRILSQAEALLVEHPVRTELTEAEIKRIADYFYAHELGADEGQRRVWEGQSGLHLLTLVLSIADDCPSSGRADTRRHHGLKRDVSGSLVAGSVRT